MELGIKNILLALAVTFVVTVSVTIGIFWVFYTFGGERAMQVIAPVGFGIVFVALAWAVVQHYRNRPTREELRVD